MEKQVNIQSELFELLMNEGQLTDELLSNWIEERTDLCLYLFYDWIQLQTLLM